MYKKLLGLVFAGALVVGAMLPGAALAGHDNGNKKSQDDAASRVEVCHKGRLINVSERAADAHERHGDGIGVDADPCPPV